jgi:DNA-3-methyladenine glycosylase II
MTGSAAVVSGGSGLPDDDARRLAQAHELFGVLLERNGLPPTWRRAPTFATLVRLILEQQVSLRSAAAAFNRLASRVGAVTPEAILASSDAALKLDGFSRQKTRYVRDLSRRVLSGSLSAEALEGDVDVVREALLEVTGIGPWTASCFQLFALGHPDVWPTGDRALYVSLGRNLGRDDVPSSVEADAMADSWSPYRSSAARMLWYDYLGGRSYEPDPDAGFI